jgi:hypothetical protein
MSDNDFGSKKSKRRNPMAKTLFDPGEFKGAYAMKVHDARKEEYKRKKLKINEVLDEED